MYKNFSDYYFLPQLRGDAPAGPWFKRTTLPEIDGTGAEAVERLEDYWHLVESAACLLVLQGWSESGVLGSNLLKRFSPDGRRWESSSLRAVASEIVSYARRGNLLTGPVSTDKDYLTEVPPEHWFVDTTKVNEDGQIEYIGEQYLYDKLNDFRPVGHSERYTFGDVLKTDDLRVLFYDMGKLSRFILYASGSFRRYEYFKDESVDGTHILGPMIQGDPETFIRVEVYGGEDEDPLIEEEEIKINGNTSVFGETGVWRYPSYNTIESYHPPVTLAWLIPEWWKYALAEHGRTPINDAVVLVVVTCAVSNLEDNKSGQYKFLYPIRAKVERAPSPFSGGITDRRWVTCEYDDRAMFNFAAAMVNKMKPGYFDRNKPGGLRIHSKSVYLDLSMTVKWKLPTTWSWTPD